MHLLLTLQCYPVSFVLRFESLFCSLVSMGVGINKNMQYAIETVKSVKLNTFAGKIKSYSEHTYYMLILSKIAKLITTNGHKSSS